MRQEELIKKLREPFGVNEIEWKIQVTTQDKSRGMAVAYMDARAVQKRLDEVVGPFNWKNIYSLWQDKSQICGISIFNEERNEWVTKFDGAENTDIEPIKGGLSDSFKRAASAWGIGRYLYALDGIWVEIEPKGKSFATKQSQYEKLEKEYNAIVSKIFGVGSKDKSGNASSNDPSGERQADPVKAKDELNAKNEKASSAVSGSESKNALNNKSCNESDNITNNETSNALISENHSFDYKVRSVKPSGKSSQVLELLSGDGRVTKAYIKNLDQSIKTGACLNGVRMERKKSEYGEYNLINAYQLAA